MALDFPNSPSLNQLYAGPNNVQWQWDGSKWLGTPNTLGPVIVAASPPTFQAGQLWWDSTGGNLYLGYDDGNTQQWVPASNIAGLANAATTMDVDKALNDVGRNLIHNSAFTIAQRGSAPVNTVAGYPVDRWTFGLTGDTSYCAQFAATDADRTAVGDEAMTFGVNVNIQGTAGATAYTSLIQRIEDVRRLAGKTVIASFWAVASAAIKIGVSYSQNFATGGSPSATVSTTGTTVTASGTWTRYSVTAALPSIVGKTFGTNGNSFTGLNIWFSSAANNNGFSGGVGVQSGTVNIWGIQLEAVQPGQTVPTKLEKRDPVLELQQCQRFYQVLTTSMNGYATATTNAGCSATYLTSMRSGATITPASSGNTNINVGALTTGFLPGGVYASANVTATGTFFFTNTLLISADL